jgi:hypothetical protein
MSLPLDDEQVARHTFRQMAEQTALLRYELQTRGFTGPILDKMVMAYWNNFFVPQMPDLGELAKQMFGPKEE